LITAMCNVFLEAGVLSGNLLLFINEENMHRALNETAHHEM
jgi:hypothetical protein